MGFFDTIRSYGTILYLHNRFDDRGILPHFHSNQTVNQLGETKHADIRSSNEAGRHTEKPANSPINANLQATDRSRCRPISSRGTSTSARSQDRLGKNRDGQGETRGSHRNNRLLPRGRRGLDGRADRAQPNQGPASAWVSSGRGNSKPDRSADG